MLVSEHRSQQILISLAVASIVSVTSTAVAYAREDNIPNGEARVIIQALLAVVYVWMTLIFMYKQAILKAYGSLELPVRPLWTVSAAPHSDGFTDSSPRAVLTTSDLLQFIVLKVRFTAVLVLALASLILGLSNLTRLGDVGRPYGYGYGYGYPVDMSNTNSFTSNEAPSCSMPCVLNHISVYVGLIVALLALAENLFFVRISMAHVAHNRRVFEKTHVAGAPLPVENHAASTALPSLSLPTVRVNNITTASGASHELTGATVA